MAETNNSVSELITKAESNFINGNVQTSKYVSQNSYEDISTIDAYLNSKHISGPTDSMNREKPFFNIVLAQRNIWYRATDLDRKNVIIKATKRKKVLPAYIATLFLQKWMREVNFGMFLNKWGIQLAGYNSACVKFVEKDGELSSQVIPWDRLIFDTIDFDNNPKIEILELTPSQLRQREGYDQKVVKQLIESALEERKNVDKTNKDSNNSEYIRLYEIHGNLPLSYLTGKDKDEETYVQQMHVVSMTGSGQNAEDFTLYSGREDKDPYMLTYLVPSIDGSVSFDGSVKNLFEAQWMINHTTKQIKDQLDLASMILFQTTDGNFAGQNALSAMITGDILIHALNAPLSQVQNNSHDITAIQNYAMQWRNLAQDIGGGTDLLLGKPMPSATTLGETKIAQAEAHSNFEMMTENKGLCLEAMLRKYIIPYIKKQLKNNDEIVASLTDAGVERISSMFIKKEATKRTNAQLVDKVIAGEDVTPETQSELQSKNETEIAGEIKQDGGEIFFKPSEISSTTWNDIFKDLEWEVECDITGEASDKQAIIGTLTEVFKIIVGMQGRPMTPQEKFVFNKMLTQVGDIISPLEMSGIETPAPVSAQLPSPNGGQVESNNLQVNQ